MEIINGITIMNYAESVQHLKDNIETNPKKVHEMFDGPCKILSIEGKKVLILDNGRKRELYWNDFDSFFEYVC